MIRNRLQGAKVSNLVARNVTRCVNRMPIDLDVSAWVSCKVLGDSGSLVSDKLLKKVDVRPGFSASKGQYYCGVSLVNYAQDWLPLLRRSPVTLTLEMQLPSGVRGTMQLKVIAGIHLNVDRIHFSEESDTPEFTVVGRETLLRDIRVVASHKNLEVKKLSTTATGQENEFALRFQVRLTGSVQEANVLSVTVESPGTDQALTLPVEWPTENSCSSKPFSLDNIFSPVLSLGVIISTVIVTLTFAYSEYKRVLLGGKTSSGWRRERWLRKWIRGRAKERKDWDGRGGFN